MSPNKYEILHWDEWHEVYGNSVDDAIEDYFDALANDGEFGDNLPDGEDVQVRLPSGEIKDYTVTGEYSVVWSVFDATPQDGTE